MHQCVPECVNRTLKKISMKKECLAKLCTNMVLVCLNWESNKNKGRKHVSWRCRKSMNVETAPSSCTYQQFYFCFENARAGGEPRLESDHFSENPDYKIYHGINLVRAGNPI